ncbi:hypothetical protein FCU94_14125 [Vibrio sp. JPW-9-11-11]|uniref:winged helix-turn-helix domain-containing protein n=1 Tax=Vibrio sp. JPW-9-11-11 TaxID=1416532 RepID=UPI0015938AEB|nr:winged helix-turn-helix domain-containing protein [Vibrio sp. JPW-9-11-11]NVD08025.1 hypothetical protein [Vibrio sp. JPW-9-11-11]
MNPITLSNLSLDTESRTLSNNNGRSIVLRPLSYEVLLLLIENHGRPVRREAIYERCWQGRVVTDQALTNVISEIRRLFISLKARDVEIKTISKIGYYIVFPTDSEATLPNTVKHLPNLQNTLPGTTTNLITPQLRTPPSEVNSTLFHVALVGMLLVLVSVYISQPWSPRPQFTDSSHYQKLSHGNLLILFENTSRFSLSIESLQYALDETPIGKCPVTIYFRLFDSLFDSQKLSSKAFVYDVSTHRSTTNTVYSIDRTNLVATIAKMVVREHNSACNL